VAGSLGPGRAKLRRVQQLEEEVETSSSIEPSQTELEVWALDAEIARIEAELEELEGRQDGASGATRSERERGREGELPPGFTLDEEIRFLEELLEDSEDIGD
jgi:hypothetical protein